MSNLENEPGQPELLQETAHSWEDCKENFRPVKDGRKPDVLSRSKAKEERTVLQPKGIEEDRIHFVRAIEEYEGPDPLEKWLEYIKWTKDTFSSGGKSSELLPLLEKCTREFHDKELYRDDIRYLRVWIMYADCLPDPSDVFSYMRDHGIGQGHALFYIAYATFCELTRNYSLADTMFQKGIEANAAPLDRLKNKFSEFQHRMVRRIQRKASEQQQQARQGIVTGDERRGLKAIRGPLAARPLDKRRNISSNTGSNSISVFVDEQFSASSVQPQPRGRMVLPAGHVESQKENVQEAKAWVGQTIRQNTACLSSKPHGTLEIMEDPEFAMSEAGAQMDPRDRGASGQAISLRQRFDRDGLEEQLSSDPLLLHKNPPSPKRAVVVKQAMGNQAENVEHQAADPADPADPARRADQDPSPFDQDVTLATRDAYKAMNCLFTGDTVDQHVNEPRRSEGMPDLEPTMTVNMKEALNAVNNIFEVSFNVAEEKEEVVYVSENDNAEEDGGGLMIREDTVFLGKDEDTGGFSIREDTVFISKRHDPDPEGHEITGDFSIREDTVFLTNCEDDTDTGAHSIREDTILIPSSSFHPDNAGSISPNASNIQPSVINDSDVENDENAVPEGFLHVQHQRERTGHGPLSPIGVGGMVTSEIEISEDVDAENALSMKPCRNADAGDGFAVFTDPQPNQKLVNPFDSSFQGELVASLNPPVSMWPDVYEITEEEMKNCEAALYKCGSRTGVAIDLKVRDILHVTITGQIGHGSYATVYGGLCNGKKVAMKVERPPCPWEFLLCKVIQGRSGSDPCQTVTPEKMLLHDSFSILIMPEGQGTLQDLLNKYLEAKLRIDQCITAKICLSLFHAMEQLHLNKIVHNDIKPDNILYNVPEDVNDVSVSLIDVGRGVDLELLPKNAVLFGDSETESFRCIEMRERLPWLWQADSYAVAGVIHCLIFGEYMEVDIITNEATGETFVRNRSRLPRSYDQDTWDEVFKTLLNPHSTSVDCPPRWGWLAELMERLIDKCGTGQVEKELRKLAKLVDR
jgi:hypothetical protein